MGRSRSKSRERQRNYSLHRHHRRRSRSRSRARTQRDRYGDDRSHRRRHSRSRSRDRHRSNDYYHNDANDHDKRDRSNRNNPLQEAIRKAQQAAAALAAKSSISSIAKEDDEIDPLDAYMQETVLPEVQARQEEERKKAEEEAKELQKLLANGKLPKVLEGLIALEDEEESLKKKQPDEEPPDLVLQVPANKVKLIIGPEGSKIKEIQRKSKCRIQVQKAAIDRGFGQTLAERSAAIAASAASGERKMVDLHLFGNVEACDNARELILEAVQNRQGKERQRERAKEKKREEENRERLIHRMRHERNYKALEVPAGASIAELKAAFRRLALVWHPDKNPDRRKEAEKKFQEISKAYESLMATDKGRRVEQIDE